uniref:Guanine nucleotide-binding protein subunit beta isoform X2 n=1 Tax=Elaeis guineensis var. tenera TaxID=51953 RepID=A0A6I9QHN1_ELAGV|nr:guanine nucleotide-binding protein subunit beta isoform X2 [Elaeis guineensis]
MSVAELKERHIAAKATVNGLRERLKQRRQALLDTNVVGYANSHGKTAISLGATDLVCCRTMLGHTGKVYIRTAELEKPDVMRKYRGKDV